MRPKTKVDLCGYGSPTGSEDRALMTIRAESDWSTQFELSCRNGANVASVARVIAPGPSVPFGGLTKRTGGGGVMGLG